jgi:hypothetical protein
MKVKNILLIGIAILSFIASSQAQNVNIPNAIFKEVLLGDTSINTNGDAHIQVSEASVFNGAINVSGLGITNLTGIEAFLALTYLNCSGNQLTNLNVSACTALTYLDCSANLLMIAEVSQDCEYETIDTGIVCYEYFYFFMDSLDVSANTALTFLKCNNNRLTNLDVSANTALTTLDCSINQLANLNVSACTALTTLKCNYNGLLSLNTTGLSVLTYLECANNARLQYVDGWGEPSGYYIISTPIFDFASNVALTYLNCSFNFLSSLDVSENAALTYLNCSNSPPNYDPSNSPVSFINYGILSSLDVSSNVALTYLNCSSNGLTNLDVSSNVALISLYCALNQLTSLNVSANTALTYLICKYNHLTNLNVSANTALTYLICKYNHLTNLNVTANTSLTYLECQNNQLICLDVSQNTDLIVLWCQNNQLSCLDVSQNSALIVLFCPFNQLTSLNVKNGNNINMMYFFVGQNPPLSCINVDDAAWSTANWSNVIFSNAFFSENCSNSEHCSSATISYSSSSFCQSDTIGQAVSQTGTSGGTYSASPSGLSINASTGTITPSASSPGTYTVSYTMAALGGCAAASVTGSLNLTITPSSTNSTNTSAVGTYTWANNGQTYTSSGVYTGTTVNCVTQVLNLTITPSTSSLSLQVFLDGYYINSSNPSSMRPARYNNLVASGSANPGANTDVDIITVELRNPSNLNVVAFSVSPILQTNGSVQCVFPAVAIGASYYIVVKHRSAIPLWSGNPVIMAASSAFSFANNAVNAYSDGSITPMHTLVPSLFGIWLGELNDDGFLDGVDYTVFETDAYLSQYAGLYLLDGDLNGDAYVDASDFSVFDFNARLGSYEQRP